MNKIALSFVLLALLCGCQSEYEKTKINIEKAAKENFSSNNQLDIIRIDSFYLYELDTLTPKKLLSLKFNVLFQRIANLTEQSKLNNTDNKQALDLYGAKLDSINGLIPNADSTTFLYYFAKLKSVSTFKNMAVGRDSHFYIINKDFRIEKFDSI